MKPDLIIVWPYHVDFPLFRWMLPQISLLFERVILVFSRGNPHYDFRKFIIDNLRAYNVLLSNRPEIKSDWRDDAINYAFGDSVSDRILFIEQDFLVKNPKSFFEKIIRLSDKHNFIGYKEGERIHPAFCLVKKWLVDQTEKNFSAMPPTYDHFGLFFKQVLDRAKFVDIRDLGFKEREDFYHMAALTQNYHCYLNNQPFYKPDEFLTYNHYVQKVNVPKNEYFMAESQKIEGSFGKRENETIKNFFPKKGVE